MSRHSLTNVRRQVRGALGACTRADIKHGRRHDVVARIEGIARHLRDAEHELTIAITEAKRPRVPRHLKRAA